jgi:hypothetical protein
VIKYSILYFFFKIIPLSVPDCGVLPVLVFCLLNHFKNETKQLLNNSILSLQVNYLFQFKRKAIKNMKEINCETHRSHITDDDNDDDDDDDLSLS